MIVAYVDTTEGIWLDEMGYVFKKNTPSLIVGGHEKIKIILVKSSENRNSIAAVPSTWERDTSWAEDGNSAMLTIDNDYRHLIKLSFTNGVPPISGDVTVTVDVSETQIKEISATGELYLYKADGSYDAVAYTDIYVADGTAMFTIPNRVPGDGYQYAAVPQMPLATAYLSAESDLSQGELVFDLVVLSKRLLELTAFSSVSKISISGIELLFYRTTAENNIEKIRAYMWDSVSLRNSQGNPGYQAELPDPVKDMIATAVSELSGGALEEVKVDLASYVRLHAEGGKRYVLTPNEVTDGVEVLDMTNDQSTLMESEIVFTTSAIAFLEVSLPVWLDTLPVEPIFEAGKSYIINIRNNMAVCAEYKPGVK
jgi:hypothetical protein